MENWEEESKERESDGFEWLACYSGIWVFAKVELNFGS